VIRNGCRRPASGGVQVIQFPLCNYCELEIGNMRPSETIGDRFACAHGYNPTTGASASFFSVRVLVSQGELSSTSIVEIRFGGL
jgi:hypothetical protein